MITGRKRVIEQRQAEDSFRKVSKSTRSLIAELGGKLRIVKIVVASDESGKSAKKGWDTSKMTSFSRLGYVGSATQFSGVRDSLT